MNLSNSNNGSSALTSSQWKPKNNNAIIYTQKQKRVAIDENGDVQVEKKMKVNGDDGVECKKLITDSCIVAKNSVDWADPTFVPELGHIYTDKIHAKQFEFDDQIVHQFNMIGVGTITSTTGFVSTGTGTNLSSATIGALQSDLVQTPSLSSPSSSISLNNKNVTNGGTITAGGFVSTGSSTNINSATISSLSSTSVTTSQLVTPSISSTGTSVAFNNKDISDVQSASVKSLTVNRGYGGTVMLAKSALDANDASLVHSSGDYTIASIDGLLKLATTKPGTHIELLGDTFVGSGDQGKNFVVSGTTNLVGDAYIASTMYANDVVCHHGMTVTNDPITNPNSSAFIELAGGAGSYIDVSRGGDDYRMRLIVNNTYPGGQITTAKGPLYICPDETTLGTASGWNKTIVQSDMTVGSSGDVTPKQLLTYGDATILGSFYSGQINDGSGRKIINCPKVSDIGDAKVTINGKLEVTGETIVKEIVEDVVCTSSQWALPMQITLRFIRQGRIVRLFLSSTSPQIFGQNATITILPGKAGFIPSTTVSTPIILLDQSGSYHGILSVTTGNSNTWAVSIKPLSASTFFENEYVGFKPSCITYECT